VSSKLTEIDGTVNSGNNGSAYKELPVIRNWFCFLNLYSLFYVKNMDIADPITRKYHLEGTDFPVPMLINYADFVRLEGTHFWLNSHLSAWLPDNF